MNRLLEIGIKELNKNSRGIIVLLCCLILVSCGGGKTHPQEIIIAQINGDILTEEMLVELADVSNINDLSSTLRREKIDEWIKITLLAQEADSRGLTDNPQIKSRIALAEKTIKANLMLASMFHNITPTETEMFNYYQIHKGRYVGQDRDEYRIQRIAFRTEAKADSVSRLILNEELTFNEAARIYSEEQARETEGFIGYLTEDEMDAATRRAVNILSPWRYMKAGSGNRYYLVRYTDKRTRRSEKSFTEVIDEVREEIVEEQKTEIMNGLLKRLTDNSEIIISK